jgi:hypothetical protein
VAEPGGTNIAERPSARVVPAVLIGVVLIALFVAPLRAELRFAIFPQDEGLLLVYPTEILRGAIPNHSFDSVYGIVNLWILAGAFKIFGTSLVVERYVGIVYRFLLVASLVTLVWRRRGPVSAASSGAICIVLLTGTLGLLAFAWLAALAFCAVGFLLVDVGLDVGPGSAPKSVPLAVGGVAFGMAIGCRLDIGLAVVLAVGVLVWCRRPQVRWLLGGVAIGLVPLLVNLVQAGPAAVIRDQIIEPVFVSGPYRRLPLSTLTWEELILLALCVVVAVGSCVLGVAEVRRDPSAWAGVLLLTVGAFEVGILDQAFQRSDSLHLAFVACFVLPAALVIPIRGPRSAPSWLRSIVVPLIVGVVVVLLAWPYFGRIYWSSSTKPLAPEETISNSGRSVVLGSSSDVTDLGVILRELDARAKPGDRVFVGPSDLRTANYDDTFIYFLLPDLDPGSYFLEMNPGVANGTGSRLSSDITSDRFLVLTSRWNTLAGASSVPPLGPDEPNRIVSSDFEPVVAAGPWTLYQRKS